MAAPKAPTLGGSKQVTLEEAVFAAEVKAREGPGRWKFAPGGQPWQASRIRSSGYSSTWAVVVDSRSTT